MYSRPPPTINHPATQFSAAPLHGTHALREQNKENEDAAAAGPPLPKPAPPPQKHKHKPRTLRGELDAESTVVVADTLDFAAVSVHEVSGTALTPENLLAGLDAEDDDVYYHLWVAVNRAIEAGAHRLRDGDLSKVVGSAMERLVVEVGLALRGRNEGPQFVFVDPRRNDDAAAMVGSARRLVALFRARGVSVNKVIISIPATENGVAAAKELAAQGICTNLILVASLMHAAICAEAGATTISIAVGALLRAHERKRKAVYRDFAMHPGMEIIQATLTYFKQHKIPTRVVGRDFRQLAELKALPGFDAVCLSKTQLEALRWRSETRPVGALLDRAPQASMRANQAQHPTAFLEHGAEFMRLMSAGARGMVAASVFPALGRMELQMNIIEKMVREEVAWQLALRTLPIEVLFELRSPLPPSRAAEMRRKHKSNQARTRVGSQKRKPLEDACERENEGGLIEGVEYF